MEPDGVNQIWVSDITYIATLEGWLYLAVILDLFSRKVVGWKLGESLEAELVVNSSAKRLNDADPGSGALFPFRSRKPVQQPGRAQALEGDRSQFKYEWVGQLLR